ncbi:Nre family DNA repair protein [Thermoplasma acidophilum]|nr:Nre family DNA repair protein [Thermoplasma acidophilum]
MPVKAKMSIPASLCMRCRGAKRLCGLSYCPIEIEMITRSKISGRSNIKEIDGSSPPSVFVGRYGYPKVSVYPSAPPIRGDTSNLSVSASWLDMPLEEFISARLSMLRGSREFAVDAAVDPDALLQRIQEISLSKGSVDVDILLERPIDTSKIEIDDHVTPMGPASPMKTFSLDPSGTEQHIEKVYYDTDMKAKDAVMKLYENGIDIERISQSLSVGIMGEGKNRKIVPTRWSITAVDSMISDDLIEEAKQRPTIDKFLAYRMRVNGNYFMAILTPSNWIYEWGESWFPGSTWNMWGNQAEVEIDYEGYNGRKTYPDIGGCYYSSRVAVGEAFKKLGRSGGAITWREIYPGFNIPVGVWFVRENMRRLFAQKPEVFDTIDEAMNYVSEWMRVPPEKWKSNSYVYKTLKYNNLERFFSL